MKVTLKVYHAKLNELGVDYLLASEGSREEPTSFQLRVQVPLPGHHWVVGEQVTVDIPEYSERGDS